MATAYPQVVNSRGRFGHRQKVHILLQHRHRSQMDHAWIFQVKSPQWKHSLYTCAPIQDTPLDRYINGSVCKAPAHPPRKLLRGSVQSLVLFSKCRSPFYPSHTNSLGSEAFKLHYLKRTCFPRCQLLPTLVLKDPQNKNPTCLDRECPENLSSHELY